MHAYEILIAQNSAVVIGAPIQNAEVYGTVNLKLAVTFKLPIACGTEGYIRNQLCPLDAIKN